MDPRDFIAPMLATKGSTPFDHPDWWFEVKWDGYRAIVSNVDRLRIYSRHGLDLLHRYPDLYDLADVLPRPVVLDAEVVAWTNGRPSFAHLQRRGPVAHVVMAFDCLYTRQGWHLHRPLRERIARLQDVVASRGMVVVPGGVREYGRDFYLGIQEKELEGVMAKRLDSIYIPGKRVVTWQKWIVATVDWFWVPVVTQDADSGLRFWRVAEKIENNWHFVYRLIAPADWHPSQEIQNTSGDFILEQPIRVELAFRERTKEGYLRHASIRRWQ